MVVPKPAPSSDHWLPLLYASRFGNSIPFMMYAGTLDTVMRAWDMTARQAGLIQTTFNVCYAVSLVVTAVLADILGPRRLLLWASSLTALSSLAIALLARSPTTALVLFATLGLTQGGTYSPALMLIARGSQYHRRGAAMGWMLASSSFGYFASILLSTSIADSFGYQAAFLACSSGPALAYFVIASGRRLHPDRPVAPSLSVRKGFARRCFSGREAALTTVGYAAHCWELLGMWAWMPTFLAKVMRVSIPSGSFGISFGKGLWIASATHIAGGLASLIMGHTSDHFGQKRILIMLAITGAASSLTMGWLVNQPLVIVFVFASFYGFVAIGDSPVWSAAITESVDDADLGLALGLRSILGFGGGGLAPLAFGAALGSTGDTFSWPAGFAVLGLGGIVATLCAVMLPARQKRPRSESLSR